MRWLTSEGKWWSGLIVFLIISVYFAPKAVNRFQSQFLEAAESKSRIKAIAAALKMLFWGQGCFLLLAFIFYTLMALGVSIWKMAFHLDGWAVAGVMFLSKVFGLILANIVFVPIVCLIALYVFKRCAVTANKAMLPTANAAAD